MSQWQSLCLALVVSITSASAAFPQAPARAVEIQSGDVWSLPGDRASPVAAVPQASANNGDLPTGDVWLSPDRQTTPSRTAEEFHPGDTTVANRKE
jgi:hypothetical protein